MCLKFLIYAAFCMDCERGSKIFLSLACFNDFKTKIFPIMTVATLKKILWRGKKMNDFRQIIIVSAAIAFFLRGSQTLRIASGIWAMVIDKYP